MRLENIRPNFTSASPEEQHELFFKYAEKRNNDFTIYSLAVVKPKTTKAKAKKSKEPVLKLNEAQLALLKMLGLA
jgi:hypothetical protein